MRIVTLTGDGPHLRLKSGRIIRRGVPTEVTNDEAARLKSRHGAHVSAESEPDPEPDES